MPRRKNLDARTQLTLKLPESVRARLDLFLFSNLEGRVPMGAYQEFFIERIRAYFDHAKIDLAPFGFPVGYSVEGPKEVMAALVARLKAK